MIEAFQSHFLKKYLHFSLVLDFKHLLIIRDYGTSLYGSLKRINCKLSKYKSIPDILQQNEDKNILTYKYLIPSTI